MSEDNPDNPDHPDNPADSDSPSWIRPDSAGPPLAANPDRSATNPRGAGTKRKRGPALSSRSVAALTPEQLEKKRKNDREVSLLQIPLPIPLHTLHMPPVVQTSLTMLSLHPHMAPRGFVCQHVSQYVPPLCICLPPAPVRHSTHLPHKHIKGYPTPTRFLN